MEIEQSVETVKNIGRTLFRWNLPDLTFDEMVRPVVLVLVLVLALASVSVRGMDLCSLPFCQCPDAGKEVVCQCQEGQAQVRKPRQRVVRDDVFVKNCARVRNHFGSL